MPPSNGFDEMGWPDAVRPPYALVDAWIRALPPEQLALKRREAEVLFRRIGITFAVYSEGGDPERLIPFDLIPRVLAQAEWQRLKRGLEQRVRALNAFIHDVYHGQEILRAGRIPERLVLHNSEFRAEMAGMTQPHRVYSHIAGIDMVRTGPDQYYVLEDNCRTPSGVSYMVENRELMLRLCPDLFRKAPVAHYPDELLDTLRSVAPPNCRGGPTVALLTPGIHNSAYYEHAFLADEMGIELVEGDDLLVEGDVCWMRTTRGLERVDVLYRRIDDDYIDPLAFREDSLLGVPGLYFAHRAGNLTLANAIGAGIADDKAVYIHVPEMIRFYLGEEPLLSNVPTWDCSKQDELKYTLEHLDELVVKAVHGSGGYGMLVGPHASREEREAFAARLRAKPHDYIAQPTLALSTVPIFVDQGIAPRHVDLRPFVLSGDSVRIVPGGLTRVALREGSLVVNSSQGGGTKDTWVLES
ncbi:MAG TPA: circularly permuted type 2 ATP-grasp protein [Xanthomonadaceae bacterium]|nr:circularly permuted type 2 ATP-grasp protein [Xanthomonadaceae bacterium]